MLEDGRDVGGQELLVLADADDERAVAARAYQQIGLFAADDGDGVGAVDPLQGQPRRQFEVVPRLNEVVVFDQVRKHFGIRLGAEAVTAQFQFAAQLSVVLDDAVVNDGQHARAVGMGMRVGVVGASMRGPARVADAERAFHEAVIVDGCHQVGELSCLAQHFQRAVFVQDGNARRIVTTIFQFTQAIKQYGSSIGPFGADVANDTAHEVGYPFFFVVLSTFQ